MKFEEIKPMLDSQIKDYMHADAALQAAIKEGTSGEITKQKTIKQCIDNSFRELNKLVGNNEVNFYILETSKLYQVFLCQKQIQFIVVTVWN